MFGRFPKTTCTFKLFPREVPRECHCRDKLELGKVGIVLNTNVKCPVRPDSNVSLRALVGLPNQTTVTLLNQVSTRCVTGGPLVGHGYPGRLRSLGVGKDSSEGEGKVSKEVVGERTGTGRV